LFLLLFKGANVVKLEEEEEAITFPKVFKENKAGDNDELPSVNKVFKFNTLL